MNTTLLYFKKGSRPAKKLAKSLNIESKMINCHHFPDGESLITLPEKLSKRVIIYTSLNKPNNRLIELLFAAKGARKLGAKNLILVAPYMCYMRQDKTFLPGQVVSQQIIGEYLGDLFDFIITVDAHLHRVQNIKEIFPKCEAINLSASSEIAKFLSKLDERATLIGPDEESLQWVKKIAKACGLNFGVCKKNRLGDKAVEIEIPKIDLSSIEKVILIDDIISSGKTAAVSAKMLKKAGAKKIDCIVTHAVFAKGAQKILKEAGIDKIITTDSIPHRSNKIELAPVLSEAIYKILGQC